MGCWHGYVSGSICKSAYGLADATATDYLLLHTHTHNRFTALWNLSGKTRVSRYQKKHSPTTLIVVINHPYQLSPYWFYLPGFTFLVLAHLGSPGQNARGQ